MPERSEREARERARAALEPIKHIVVLMLENRSFDHMLGYLAIGEPIDDRHELPVKVEGLGRGRANTYGGKSYTPKPLPESALLRKDLDPPHDACSVERQIADEMGGFVAAYAAALAERDLEREAQDPEIREAVMGYMTAE